MDCEVCKQPLAEVVTRVGDHVLTMGSCANCARRYWYLEDQVIDLTDALQLLGRASGRKPQRTHDEG